MQVNRGKEAPGLSPNFSDNRRVPNSQHPITSLATNSFSTPSGSNPSSIHATVGAPNNSTGFYFASPTLFTGADSDLSDFSTYREKTKSTSQKELPHAQAIPTKVLNDLKMHNKITPYEHIAYVKQQIQFPFQPVLNDSVRVKLISIFESGKVSLSDLMDLFMYRFINVEEYINIRWEKACTPVELDSKLTSTSSFPIQTYSLEVLKEFRSHNKISKEEFDAICEGKLRFPFLRASNEELDSNIAALTSRGFDNNSSQLTHVRFGELMDLVLSGIITFQDYLKIKNGGNDGGYTLFIPLGVRVILKDSNILTKKEKKELEQGKLPIREFKNNVEREWIQSIASKNEVTTQELVLLLLFQEITLEMFERVRVLKDEDAPYVLLEESRFSQEVSEMEKRIDCIGLFEQEDIEEEETEATGECTDRNYVTIGIRIYLLESEMLTEDELQILDQKKLPIREFKDEKDRDRVMAIANRQPQLFSRSELIELLLHGLISLKKFGEIIISDHSKQPQIILQKVDADEPLSLGLRIHLRDSKLLTEDELQILDQKKLPFREFKGKEKELINLAQLPLKHLNSNELIQLLLHRLLSLSRFEEIVFPSYSQTQPSQMDLEPPSEYSRFHNEEPEEEETE